MAYKKEVKKKTKKIKRRLKVNLKRKHIKGNNNDYR